MRKILEKVYTGRKEEFFDQLRNNLEQGNKRFIVTANPEIIMSSLKDHNIKQMLLDENTDIIADGIGVVKACHQIQMDAVEKIAGVDTVAYLLKSAHELHKKLFVLGCTQEVLDLFHEVIKEKYPGIAAVKFINGYIPDKDQALLENIDFDADIVLVALGVPKQEQLIYQHYSQFHKGIFVGIGGSIDVLSGTKNRAPDFFVNHNLEWFYRIIKEPKRMKRFVKNNLKFVREVKKL